MTAKLLYALPLHHVDTSVLVEPPDTEYGMACRRYLQRIGYNYRGQVALPVLGELMLAMLKTESYDDRQDFIEWLTDTIRIRRIEEYIPRSVGAVIEAVQKADKRLHHTDVQIVACAVEANADVLVTLDADLIESESLKNSFRIKIKHPRELV